jgi:hypothetical protein
MSKEVHELKIVTCQHHLWLVCNSNYYLELLFKWHILHPQIYYLIFMTLIFLIRQMVKIDVKSQRR